MPAAGEFADRTVLVTGAAHGLGRGIALAFADAGARVWGCDVNRDSLAETVKLSNGRVETRHVDVTDRAGVQRFAHEALEATGRIDVLVNDAGGLAGQSFQPVDEISEEDFAKVMAINVTGTFLCTAAVTPAMKRAGYGRIVNISSGAGLALTVTGIQAYASAKAAVIGFTRQTGHELGPFGITVNCVAPGSIPCNPYSAGKWERLGPEGRKAALERIAMRRVGTPQDIANAVMFFAGEGAGWVTGQTLLVDGGK